MPGPPATAVTVPALRLVEAAALGERASRWDALVEASPLPSAFLMSWWLAAAADRARCPCFVLVLDGDDLVGGVALDEDGRRWSRRIRLLGDGPLAPDHLDLVAAPGLEDEVVRALATWLRGRGPALVDLRGVAGGARLLRVVPERSLVTVMSSAPHLALGGEAPPRPLHGATNLARQARRLAGEGASYRVVDGDDARAFDRALAELRHRHVERWDERTGFIREFSALEVAARAGAPTGAVCVHELVVDDEVVASELTFDVGGRRHLYQTGRSTAHRWRGAGNVLHGEAIAEAWTRGLREYDFLRGREPYKYRWTAEERPVLRVRAAVGAAPSAMLGLAATAERGRPLARRLKAWLRRRPVRRPRPGWRPTPPSRSG